MPDYVNKNCGYVDETNRTISISTSISTVVLTLKKCFFYDTKSFQDEWNDTFYNYKIEYDRTTKKYKNIGNDMNPAILNIEQQGFLGFDSSNPSWIQDDLADNPTTLPEGQHTTPKIMSCPDSTAVSEHTKDLIQKNLILQFQQI